MKKKSAFPMPIQNHFVPFIRFCSESLGNKFGNYLNNICRNYHNKHYCWDIEGEQIIEYVSKDKLLN